MFEVGKLIHSGKLYDQVNTFSDDQSFYLESAVRSEGSCLELCCGTGRLTIPIASQGVQITGVDIERSMLDQAREKAKLKGIEVDFIEGDVRSIDLGRKYSFVFIPFNSLQCIYSLDDIRSVLINVKKHLNDDGLFAFDVFNPNLKIIYELLNGERHRGDFEIEGEKVSIYETMTYDSANQVARIIWKHKFDNKVVEERLDMRNFFPQEMDFILDCLGFRIEDKFGSFTKEPFTKDSFKQIYRCRMK